MNHRASTKDILLTNEFKNMNTFIINLDINVVSSIKKFLQSCTWTQTFLEEEQ